jgi:hypothetical protein
MSGSIRTLARRGLVALVVVSAAIAAAASDAEIFKCSTKDGKPLYQNFPCSIDSIGSVASRPAPQAKGGQVPVKASAAAGEPRLYLGMSEDEVTSMFGPPDETLEDEPRSGRVSVWRYGERIFLTFDVKRRLSAVQQ